MTVFRLCKLVHNHHTSRFLPSPTVRHFANTRAMMSVLDTIKKDHRELEEYYSNIVNAKDDNNQTQWQDQFTRGACHLSRVGKHLGEEGVRLANKDRREHQVVGKCYVKEKLKKFQGLTPTEPEFIPTIESLMKDLAQHIEEEETSDFPKLQNALQSLESETWPMAGLLAAPIDCLADVFRKFPK
ncbi:hypothetical protein V1525DRAFT_410851 [Lipomyces kononenkoae]|uniref:Uncharacterized protein n=1 Tax=Lipomyces kononenkoae TaxID=34357 RepID=A0ACC3SUT4_LIPKO